MDDIFENSDLHCLLVRGEMVAGAITWVEVTDLGAKAAKFLQTTRREVAMMLVRMSRPKTRRNQLTADFLYSTRESVVQLKRSTLSVDRREREREKELRDKMLIQTQTKEGATIERKAPAFCQ